MRLISRSDRCACLFALLLTGELWLSAHSSERAIVLRDATAESGFSFQHENGMNGNWYLPEITGSGLALLDFDQDGDLDIYCVQGGWVEQSSAPAATYDRLFRNDTAPGSRTLLFKDVTRIAKIPPKAGYGMGVAVGDVNNDGYPDLYLTNLGTNQLLVNRTDGTFAEGSLPVSPPEWSTSASFVDYDGDGRLDIYVANYVEFHADQNPTCYSETSARDYCGPDAFPADRDRLYRNRGDGSFEETSAEAGLRGVRAGAGLGTVTVDFNRDGRMDIYVANDGDPNHLWINQGEGRFSEQALLAGLALNFDGIAEAGMGVDAADFDFDGDEDIFVTHLTQETNTLYVNLGEGQFEDQTIRMGLSVPSLMLTGFGSRWADFDQDGWLDLVMVNGAVKVLRELQTRGDPYPLGQPNQLLRRIPSARFEDVSHTLDGSFRELKVSRGLAVGDLDNDGDLDLVITNNNGPARLYVNESPARPWVGLEILYGRRPALGAWVRVETGKRTFWRRVRTDGSYLSAGDARILVPVDPEARLQVSVYWLDGTVETFAPAALEKYHRIVYGKGKTIEANRR